MSFKGFKHTEESKRKIGLGHKGGFPHTEASLEKIRLDKLRKTLARFTADLRDNDCWDWDGHSIGKHGNCRRLYELFVGPIKQGLYLCHHCDNPYCVRPTHWFLGTQKDNMQDMARKGRSTKGRPCPEYVKEASRIAKLGKMLTEDHKKKLSRSRQGNKNYLIGTLAKQRELARKNIQTIMTDFNKWVTA